MNELERIEDIRGFTKFCPNCGTSGEALTAIRAYLLSHETDIAYGVNDFGDLSTAFELLIGRPVKEQL